MLRILSKYMKCNHQCYLKQIGKRYSSDVNVAELFRNVMRNVPHPVVVVTTAIKTEGSGQWKKRGVTCSSFNSISLRPPVVSFAITKHSRMHGMLMDADQFGIHVLSKNQVAHSVHFSKPTEDGVDQFEKIPHEMDTNGVPILRDSSAVLLCSTHSVHTIGDHHVWYGNVQHAYSNGQNDSTLLYYLRSFRSVGDEAFLQAFENTSLPFADWTHEAHLRMSWNYLKEHDKETATSLIKQGILRYNEQNKEKLGRGYHETVTMFYINMICEALAKGPEAETLDEFLQHHPHLLDRELLFRYYSDERINNAEAKSRFLLPDKIKTDWVR